jgi:hypothetical protein
MVNLDVLISSESELIKMSDFTLDAGGGGRPWQNVVTFPTKSFHWDSNPGHPN